MTFDELQSAISQLSVEEVDRLSRWLEEYRADLWDRRMEADIRARRLDPAARRADVEFKAGHYCTPLHISARLIRRGWLHRAIEVSLPDGLHIVEYDGKGFGFEHVSVDGMVFRKTSWSWFVPRFEFKIGSWMGVIEVRVSPWLSLRSLVLHVGDRVVYTEGVNVEDGILGGLTTNW